MRVQDDDALVRCPVCEERVMDLDDAVAIVTLGDGTIDDSKRHIGQVVGAHVADHHPEHLAHYMQAAGKVGMLAAKPDGE